MKTKNTIIDEDFYICSNDWTKEDTKEFSAFLKANKKSIYNTKSKSAGKKTKKAA